MHGDLGRSRTLSGSICSMRLARITRDVAVSTGRHRSLRRYKLTATMSTMLVATERSTAPATCHQGQSGGMEPRATKGGRTVEKVWRVSRVPPRAVEKVWRVRHVPPRAVDKVWRVRHVPPRAVATECLEHPTGDESHYCRDHVARVVRMGGVLRVRVRLMLSHR